MRAGACAMTSKGASRPIPVRVRSSGTIGRLASTDFSVAKWAAPTAVGLHFQPVSFGKSAVKITKIRGTNKKDELEGLQPICVLYDPCFSWMTSP